MATTSDHHPYDYVDPRPEHYVEQALGRPMLLSILLAVVFAALVAGLLVYALR